MTVVGYSADAKKLYERDWLEARSPNFIVLSALKEKPTRTLIQELEDFRQIVAVFTNVSVLEPRVPTILFVFSGPVADIGLENPIGGYLRPRMRANYAVVRYVEGGSVSHFIQHEYTHFLLRNQGRQAYPRWYDEGIAEVLATVNLRDGAFDFGNADAGRLYALGSGVWLKYPQLIDDSQTTKLTVAEGYMYYAQSWALVHYLTWGRQGTNFTAQLGAYLADRETGTPAVPAFEKAFEEDVGKLNDKVRRYLSKAKYSKGGLRQPFDAGQVAVKAMPRDAIAAALGNLCIVTGHSDNARPYVDAALASNPRNARALVDLADLNKFDKKFDEARPLYEQAIGIEPQNNLHHLDFGEYWLDLAEATQEPANRQEFLKLARRELVQADKLDDKNPETLAIYGSSFLLEGEDPRKGIDTLELAQQLLPSQPQIKFLLARAYASVDRTQEARSLLLELRAWAHEGGSEAADKLLREIDEREKAATAPSLEAVGR